MNVRDRNRLAKLLLSMSSDDEGMLLSEFDGFCAGLVACPDIIPPEEWLAVGKFAAHDAVNIDWNSTEALIRTHYDAVAMALGSPGVDYDSIFDRDSVTGEILWEPWICGFHRAMQLRPEAWEEMLESGQSDVVAAITTVKALFWLAVGKSALPAETTSALTNDAPGIILGLVTTMVSWKRDDCAHT